MVKLFGREKKGTSEGKAQKLYEAGMALYNTQDDPGAFEEAAKDFRIAADAGHVESQFMLGECNRHSIMYDRSWEEAAKYYRMAAESGHILAQFRMGQLYEEGSGVPQSRSKAGEWYLKAAEKELPEAQYAYAVLCEEGDCDGDAEFWYKKAAETGHELAAKALERVIKK